MTELQQDLDVAVARLRELGARPDEVDELLEGWDDFSDPSMWSPEIRRRWVRSADSELLTELGAVRMMRQAQIDHPSPTVYDVDLVAAPDDVDDDRAFAVVKFPELDEIMTGSIAVVLAWVDDDRERAQAAIGRELEGQNRTSLLASLGLVVARS